MYFYSTCLHYGRFCALLIGRFHLKEIQFRQKCAKPPVMEHIRYLYISWPCYMYFYSTCLHYGRFCSLLIGRFQLKEIQFRQKCAKPPVMETYTSCILRGPVLCTSDGTGPLLSEIVLSEVRKTVRNADT